MARGRHRAGFPARNGLCRIAAGGRGKNDAPPMIRPKSLKTLTHRNH